MEQIKTFWEQKECNDWLRDNSLTVRQIIPLMNNDEDGSQVVFVVIYECIKPDIPKLK